MFQTVLFSLLAALPLVAHQQGEDNHAQARKTIDADQLKSWYDHNKEMTVLDARTSPYFDGTLLPNAKWLPGDSSDKAITAALPSKEALIVVYCAGVGCPASGWLYDRLEKLGYTNVFEFHDGLKGWMKKGYPTTKK
jgi:rhodanese-related sulfurtransferase